jgi:hypothetical protein
VILASFPTEERQYNPNRTESKQQTMATPAPRSTPGNMASFNILHGYPEALVRGMRSSFLADADYHHLTQCETLDDVRLNLSETDYGDVLADMNTLIPTGLQKAAVDKVRIIHLRVVNYQCYVIEDGS